MNDNPNGYDVLIEALHIFKRCDPDPKRYAPTNCNHDVFAVCIPRDAVSADDAKRLNELSFGWSSEYDGWVSYLFGSC